MTQAYIIQSADATAGIVVIEPRGVRFYASEPGFYALDGQSFKSLRAARHAIGALKPHPQKPNRFNHAARG